MKILDLVFSVIGHHWELESVGNGMNSLPFQKVDHLASVEIDQLQTRREVRR